VDPVMIAAGMIVGVRVTVLDDVQRAVALAYVAAPIGLESISSGRTRSRTRWCAPRRSRAPRPGRRSGIWLGAPIMVTSSGLLAFAFQWRTIAARLHRQHARIRAVSEDPRITADVEVPMSWFVVGTGSSGIGIVLLAWLYFEVPPLLGALAVVLTFFLALVAARATGESDVTPTGAMGKIMQLTYGC
jgi:hypothetical protein